jgi:hypothetical protein
MRWRAAMSDADVLVEQLRRSNRRWKALALAASTALVLLALAWYASAVARRIRMERALAEVNALVTAQEKAAAQQR